MRFVRWPPYLSPGDDIVRLAIATLRRLVADSSATTDKLSGLTASLIDSLCTLPSQSRAAQGDLSNHSQTLLVEQEWEERGVQEIRVTIKAP